MIADELRRVAYQKPFKAFQVQLVSGEVIDVSRNLRTTVAKDRVLIGVDADPATGLARRLRMIPLSQINRVVAVSPAPL